MEELMTRILKLLKPYFDSTLRTEPSGRMYLYDDELGEAASCCTTGEVACLYLLDSQMNGGNGNDIAARLMEDLHQRQLPEGGFPQPYYGKKGETPIVDIAEIGAVANSLYHVWRITGEDAAKQALLRSSRYLLTQVVPQCPGAVYKNPQSDNDVINGDIYAAHTFGRAYQVSGDTVFLERVVATIEHVANRFGKNSSGWWPYIESWDGQVVMGNSTSYQGTIIAFADTCLPLVSAELREKWNRVANAALDTMLVAMQGEPNDETEVPWWARDWGNAWEIYLAYWRLRDREDAKQKVMGRLAEVETKLKEQGISFFKPKVKHDDPERKPVTTTFRKAATFAGIFSYMCLDE